MLKGLPEIALVPWTSAFDAIWMGGEKETSSFELCWVFYERFQCASNLDNKYDYKIIAVYFPDFNHY